MADRATFILKALRSIGPGSLLDVGCGDAEVAGVMHAEGTRVVTCDLRELETDWTHISGSFWDRWQDVEACGPYDVVVVSHVLEHVQDTGHFLRMIRGVLSRDGKAMILVPPLKHAIVGGHVHLWNMGLLIYNLILAGFDCRGGSFVESGYNLVAVVGRNEEPLPVLKYDRGDIETLNEVGLWPFDAKHGFDGRINTINWRW